MKFLDVPPLRALAQTLALTAVLCLTGCAVERIRNHADKLRQQGRYDEAVAVLADGVARYPDNVFLHAGLAQTRTDALAQLLSQASSLRMSGRLDEAERMLKRAAPFDAGGERVSALLNDVRIERQQDAALQRAQALLDQQQPDAALRAVNEALKDNPRHAELVALQRRLDMLSRQSQLQGSRLGLAESRPISLDFRDAGLRAVLDAVTRNSGVNFVLDKDIRPDVRVTIYLRSARVEDALDLIVSTNQLAKKVLDEKTVLIYPNTVDKQHEYQEQVVKVLYLANGDVKGAAAFLRSMLKMRDPFVDERSNMLALRDAPETVQLAERLMALYDAPDPEVLLEVEIVEIDATKLTNLGIQWPSGVTLTPLSAKDSSGLTLSSLKGLTGSQVGVSPLSVTINLLKQVGDVNILANPRIRARSREKAKILIGDKVPVITATVGTNGFVSDSVAYQDVGLKLDVEPTVYPDDEVAIKVGLEVSTLGAQVQTTNGSSAYQISTRNAGTVLRLRDGETQLLAGLINRQETNSSKQIPGAGDFPVLGRLFGSESNNSQRTELVLSITPHVLRSGRHPDASETELWIGTEAFQRLRAVGGRAPAALAVEPEGSGHAVVVPSPANAPVPPAPESKPDVPPPLGKLSWLAPTEVKVGETFQVQLMLSQANELRTLPLDVLYPQGVLQVVSVEQAKPDGSPARPVGFTRQIDADAGIVRMNSLYPQGMTGEAGVAVVQAKALRAGEAVVQLRSGDAGAAAQGMGPALTFPAALTIRVKP